jgi:hypothetical protein
MRSHSFRAWGRGLRPVDSIGILRQFRSRVHASERADVKGGHYEKPNGAA